MDWVSTDWKQDDSIFYGYPIPVSTAGIPESPDVAHFNHPWIFDDLFYGYPHHEDSLLKPESPDVAHFNHPWIFDDLFYGYPHTLNLQAKSVYPVFTGFSIAGIGAGFRQTDEHFGISLPEEICFHFKIEEQMIL